MSMDKTTLQNLFNDHINVILEEEKKRRMSLLKSQVDTFVNSAIMYEWYKKNIDNTKNTEFKKNLIKTLTENDYKLWDQIVQVNKKIIDQLKYSCATVYEKQLI